MIFEKIDSDVNINIIVGSIINENIANINILFISGYIKEHYPSNRPINYHSIEYHLNYIKTNPTLKHIYTIKGEFPLNINGTNKDVLDKILELTDKTTVNFYNKMCGTCFRSMHYLVNNAVSNFTYTANPEQQLTDADTPDIRKCFKK